jgi:NOL1/NOP2/fmu family ribosome biogenesis protein
MSGYAELLVCSILMLLVAYRAVGDALDLGRRGSGINALRKTRKFYRMLEFVFQSRYSQENSFELFGQEASCLTTGECIELHECQSDTTLVIDRSRSTVASVSFVIAAIKKLHLPQQLRKVHRVNAVIDLGPEAAPVYVRLGG